MAALTMNEIFYERYIHNNFYLNVISYDEYGLYLKENGQVIKEVDFISANDLADLPISCYRMNDALLFLDALEINNKCKLDIHNIDIDEEMDLPQKIDRSYLPIRFILMKPETTEEDDQTIIDFIIKYNQLVNCNGYLEEEATITFKQMSSILNWTSKLNNPNNNSETIIRQYLWSLNEGTNNDYINSINQNNHGMGKDTSLVRTSSKHPSVISDDLKMDKAGFLSFIGLLYIAFNLLITLVILAIKK